MIQNKDVLILKDQIKCMNGYDSKITLYQNSSKLLCLTPKASTQQFWYDLESGQAPYESNFTRCGSNFGTTWEVFTSF